MANPFYGATGNPVAVTRGTSSLIRAEFVAIQTGFDSVLTRFASTDTTISAKGAIAGQTWTGTHDYTGATIKVPTLAYGASGAFAASIDYVNAALLNAAYNLPGQAGNAGKFLKTNGSTTSWAFPGIATVNALVTSSTTLAGSFLHVPVQMASLGQAIWMPDATTLPVGGPLYVIDNSKGTYAAGIRDNAGTLLMGVAPGGVALVSLKDNSTVAGVWAVTGSNLEPGLVTVDQTLAGGYGITAALPFVALDANTSIHFCTQAPNGFAAFVVNNTTKTAGAPSSVVAASGATPVAAFKINSTQAIVFYSTGSTGTHNAVVLSVSGSTVSAGTPASLSFTASAAGWDGEDSKGAPKIAQLSSSLYVAVLCNGSTSTVAVAASVSGTTVTIGATAQIEAASSASASQAVYPLAATTALAIYSNGSAVRAAVISVSGTTCTVGTAVTSGLGATTTPSSCQLSATKAIIALGATNAQAQAITVSGTTVSFGTLFTMDVAGPNDLQYGSTGATRYNPHLYPLGTNTALLWYSQASSPNASVACIITESGGTLTKGSTLFSSFSGATTGSSGYGALAAPNVTDFVGITQHGAVGAWRKLAVPHKISGTTITSGSAQMLPELSPTVQADAVFGVRLSQGDYLLIAANMGGVPVLRSNGDTMTKRGAISIPNLGGPTAHPVAVASSNRVVLAVPALGSASATAQIRVINMEIAS